MKWQEVIGKEGRRHLKDCGIRTLKVFRQIREWQKQQTPDACYDCRMIETSLKKAGKI